ncbi:MAG: hypothetical protein HZC24_01130 [Rhodocyclales bacterium]|nr:hypothetical protein [Rhodocyclales bacterium]
MFSRRTRTAWRRPDWTGAFAPPPRRLLLAPSQVRVLDAASEGAPVAVAPPADPGAAPDDAAAALAAAAPLLAAERGRRIRIVVSDLWLRYSLIPVAAAASLADAELTALARGQMARQHPDTVAWPLRLALQGDALLAAVCRPDVLDGACALAANAGVRLAGVEPLFSCLWDGSRRMPPQRRDGWLLLDEPGLVMAAYAAAGAIVALHAARVDGDAAAAAASLLDRQAALLAVAAGEVRLFSCSARALALPAPWRVGAPLRC